MDHHHFKTILLHMNPCVHNTNSYVCQQNFSIVGSLLARFSVPVQQLLENVVLALIGLISCHSVNRICLPWHESYIFKSWKYNSLFCQKLEAPEAGPWLLWRLTLARRTKRRAPQSQSSARRSNIVFFLFLADFYSLARQTSPRKDGLLVVYAPTRDSRNCGFRWQHFYTAIRHWEASFWGRRRETGRISAQTNIPRLTLSFPKVSSIFLLTFCHAILMIGIMIRSINNLLIDFLLLMQIKTPLYNV